MARVLVVDDENLMRTMVEVACRRLGHEALCAATLAEGRRLAAVGVDVILLDMLLPDGNGLDAQQELAALPDAPDIVVITGHGDGDAAEKALRGGVWDFLMKPVRGRDVEETLSHVLEARDRRRSRRGLELEPGQVAGSGPAMQAALAQLEQAAHSDVNVLLLGETGVGKELFARTLYRNSHRASRPFVAVDCASLPETGRAFPSLRSWRHEAERHYVARVRALCGDDARAAARMAGVSRGHWYELLKKYGF